MFPLMGFRKAVGGLYNSCYTTLRQGVDLADRQPARLDRSNSLRWSAVSRLSLLNFDVAVWPIPITDPLSNPWDVPKVAVRARNRFFVRGGTCLAR